MANDTNKNAREAVSPGTRREPGYIHKTLVVLMIGTVFLAVLALLRWAAQALLLVFAGILVAILLRDAGDALRRRMPMPSGAALAAVLVGVLALLVAASWLMAPQVADQVAQLADALPAAIGRLRDYLESHPQLRHLEQTLPQLDKVMEQVPAVALQAGTFFSGVLGGLANLFIIAFLGVYLAMQPRIYTHGIIKLLPKGGRERGREVLRELHDTLTMWLRGKLLSMLVIGITTGLGLALIGVPLSLALGVLAGLLDFIPYIGPILAAIPAVLIAFSESPSLALYTVLLFVALQMLEGYLLLPLVEKRTVALPPALNITMQVLLGVPFGLLGVALATPLTAVLAVLVAMLYVEDVLDDRVTLPTEQK